MSKSVKIFFNLLTNPKEGYREVINDNPYWLFVLVIILVAVSVTVSCNLVSPLGATAGYFSLMSSITTITIMLIFKLLLMTAIYNFVAECLGGRAKLTPAFLGFGFSMIPLIFITPVVILFYQVPQPMKSVFSFFAMILLTIWVVYLQVTNIKEMYSLKSGKAFAVIIIPSFTLMLFVFSILATSIVSVVTKISGVFQNLPF